jgi:hypothetical protein
VTLPTPTFIPEPFATAGSKAVIPDNSGAAGRADWHLGFPPITMEAKVAGGIPPDGRDFNGVLYDLSTHVFYSQAGQPYTYSIDISDAIGGYKLGSVIGSADNKTLWYNNTADNTADPDTNNSGWVSVFTYGSIGITGLTGGTRTLSRLESRFGLIVLSGALVSNQSIVFPNDIADWRIVNNCTGAFTVTARTAAGTGVAIPQGGFTAPTGVYGNGGVSADIYLDVPPVVLPIDVAPTPNTLLMRDNTGDGFVRYLNSSAPPEAVTIANIIVTNNSDTYFRKLSFSGFLTQAFVNAALTGAPTAPTPLTTDAATRIATKEYVDNFGVGGPAQTYHDQTGSRSENVDYTNGTGRPIAVYVSVSLGFAAQVRAYVNGAPIMEFGTSTNNEGFVLSWIVPNGATYKIQHSGGSFFTITKWFELR